MKLAVLLSFCVGVFGAQNKIELVKLKPTEVNYGSSIEIQGSDNLKRNEPLYLLVTDFPVGVETPAQSTKGMRKLPYGSTVMVMVNGSSRFYIDKNDINTYEEQRNYFNKRYRKKIPSPVSRKLEEGSPVIVTVILVCSNGETVKLPNASTHRVFCYQSGCEGDSLEMKELEAPHLIYNEPYGTYLAGRPVLIDFIPKNVEISTWGSQVKMYLDDKPFATLVDVGPYALYNVPVGKHTLRLVLVDSKGKTIDNTVFPAQDVDFYVVES